MPILPVLDLMNGQIVRGIAGRRDQYRPIVSKLVDSADPLAVARAFRAHFGFTELYLADLDAIEKQLPALWVYHVLQADGFTLWIDAGLRTRNDVVLRMLIVANVPSVIVGLESVAGPDELRGIVTRIGAERVVFSLDLKDGSPLGQLGPWETADPWTIAERAIQWANVRRLIVLDLARVGVGEGVATDTFCARLKRSHPDVEVTTGGGVRGPDDVRQLLANGVDHVLVASALHDGRITRADLG